MTTTIAPIFVSVPSTRLKVRRVYEHAVADALTRDGEWHARVEHGGSVANAYGYKADTEAALAVIDPKGHVVVWMARLPANKVTSRGAADACLLGAGAIWAGRVTSEARKAAAWARLKQEHAYEVLRASRHGQCAETMGADLRAAV